MAVSNVVVIYSALALLLTPDNSIRRVVVCDTDSQVIMIGGPCQLQPGETYALMPTLEYLAMNSPDSILIWLLETIL